ncbi:MAG TPA: DOPA 4,5-dioxygenase family protein [Allosphingosinicella sp.]|nr:DOPA 4,5-dioxygenase family protein [Allosphingosinicella sp.]
MADRDAPYHAHIYYAAEQRAAAAALRDAFAAEPAILFVGRMMDRGVGPHPVPQYEVHFRERSLQDVVVAIEASGLRALVHPLTDDDMSDHTILAHWIGTPVELDVTVLDPPGRNQGMKRFGKNGFLARQDRGGRLLDAAGDEQRIAADDADLGLAVFMRAQPGDIRHDHQIVAAVRLQ